MLGRNPPGFETTKMTTLNLQSGNRLSIGWKSGISTLLVVEFARAEEAGDVDCLSG
jgi:hypothetical protein